MNQAAFMRLRTGLSRHEGKYALMKSEMVIDFFPNRQSALLAGHERFLDRLFSIHRVLPHERRHGGSPTPLSKRRRIGLQT